MSAIVTMASAATATGAQAAENDCEIDRYMRDLYCLTRFHVVVLVEAMRRRAPGVRSAPLSADSCADSVTW